MVTVTDWATCCAHCGFIEPSNMADIEADESCTTGAVYVHKKECRAMECGVEHRLFMSLWNSRTHMVMNDMLLNRINEEINKGLKPFIDARLTKDSHFIKSEPSRFWED